MKLYPFILLLSGLFAMCASAYAGGQECGEREAPNAQALAQGLALGEKVRNQLEGSGVSAALVGRVGLDLSEYGQHYTHLGLAVRDHVKKRWLVMHLYVACGKAVSQIMVQPLEQFYGTSLFDFDALVLTPSYARQAALRTTFMNPVQNKLLHQPAYNMIANPFVTKFQNSNQWILETSALAFAPTGEINDRATAQAWLRKKGFESTAIRIPNVKRSAARLFNAYVSFADHSQEEFEKQAYQVVTVDSIARFLLQQDPSMTRLVLK
ncbi:MAG: DUF2145 domain-containing protein [Cytophagales bacterium]|nr:DUF2145 domain-containing protein [Cytophagales bacterium]